MSRLGIWGAGTAFETSQRFAKMLTKRGAGAMEMAALDLKARGLYISRMLSFRGTSFEIMYIPESKVSHPCLRDEQHAPGRRVVGAHHLAFISQSLAAGARIGMTPLPHRGLIRIGDDHLSLCHRGISAGAAPCPLAMSSPCSVFQAFSEIYNETVKVWRLVVEFVRQLACEAIIP